VPAKFYIFHVTKQSHEIMDKIFKALSDKNRRQILDLVKKKPGINVNELTEYFEFSRFAVMKHLKIMVEAELIVPQKSGKNKLLYINPMPIQYIYDRWISKFSQVWASSLSQLKYSLEEEGEKVENNLKHIFVTYIKTDVKKVWKALTSGELTKKYYHGSEMRSALTLGSSIDFIVLDEDGKEVSAVKGKILEVIPNKKLSHTFEFHSNEDKPTRVTFELEEVEGMVKLTLTHDEFEGETETYKSVFEGWSYILSGLKTYLETGNTLN